MTVRQTITAPIAGALQSAFAGGGLFGVFHEGGIAGDRPPALRYADAAVFEHAPRYHGGGLAQERAPSPAVGTSTGSSPHRHCSHPSDERRLACDPLLSLGNVSIGQSQVLLRGAHGRGSPERVS
jgi:hypothetical protein